MPADDRFFLTGATGFLGSHLASALLRAGGHVTALARGGPAQTPRQRVVEVLTRCGSDATDLARLEVIEGDISAPRLGLDSTTFDTLGRSVDAIFHSAASLSFLEDDRDEIFRMNVEGTRHVLELAGRAPGRRFHHVSTAYVAGDRTDVVREDDLEAGQRFRNPYEESKYEAERMLRAAQGAGEVSVTIYRPSVVVGDSTSGEVTHFHGVYAFIRGLWAVARRLRRGKPDSEPVDLDLRIQGSAASTLNFVPIDYVTSALMTLAHAPASAGRTFHLTNPIPTPNPVWLGILCEQLGIRNVRLVGREEFADRPMTRMETMLHRQMTFYSPYLSSEPVFDCAGTMEALRPSRVTCPEMNREGAGRITGWYIDLLNGGDA